MSRRITFALAAQQDLRRLAEFLFDKNPGAAERALQAIGKAAASLSTLPHRGRLSPYPEIRELVVRVGGGPYILEYRVETDRVVVAGIHHYKEGRLRLPPDPA